MSAEYDQYLKKHISNVKEAFQWLLFRVDIFDKETMTNAAVLIDNHDSSKWNNEEYDAYDQYFYGKVNNKVLRNFDQAWLHHIHQNPHHWQYWILHEDEGRTKALEIPDEYIIEMICDWWSFSFEKGDLFEIFSWYEEHKKHMILNDISKSQIEGILYHIKNALKKGY